jgi:hypothetical protein
VTYKIGDEVIIAAPSTTWAQQFKGERGTIVDIVDGEPYGLNVKMNIWSLGFSEDELVRADLIDVLDEISEAMWVKAMEPVETDVEDEVNHPSHYTWLPNGVEVIDITELFNFTLGNSLKYIMRAGHKTEDPITDLRKAVWYINREIERLEATA